MPEIRVWGEGTLRWVEASAATGVSATGWVTASAVPTGTGTAAWAALSGLIGLVQPGQTITKPKEYAVIEDRGIPSMHKLVRHPAVDLTFSVLEGVTGDWPTGNTAIGPSALGLTEPPAFNFEWKQSVPATESNIGGIYYQVHQARIVDRQHTENAEGNVLQFTVRGLAQKGPTGAGYLS